MGTIQRIDLNRSRSARDWVSGINAAAPAIIPSIVKDDTLELAIRNFEVNPAVPAPTVFLEEPWSFTSIRASIGLIDAAPTKGKIAFTVGAQTTADLDWPADVSTTTAVSTWKATVKAAIEALSGVGVGAIRSDDPPNDLSPHFLYFTWTNAADSRPISVSAANLKLTPAVEAIVQPLQPAPAYTQLVKLVQLPFALTTAFVFAASPTPTIAAEATGAPGVNAVQILTVPRAASGAFALTWSGATTRPLSVVGLISSTIETALNEVVPPSDVKSFRVSFRSRGVFAIEFVGPLAATPCAALVPVARTAPNYTATALLPLTSAKFDRLLNGAASALVKFAVTIVDGDGPQTIIRTLTLLAPMTRDSTVTAIEVANAVLIRDNPIYISAGMGTPFAETAPGASFVPPAAGGPYVITHNLNTWRPDARVTLHTVNHTIFAADPTNLTAATIGSRRLKHTEFSQTSSSKNISSLTFGFLTVNDPTNPLDYRLLRVDIASPDTTFNAYPHKHDWDTVLETLPSGQTLRVKLAAIDAALGVFGGALSLDASRITGMLKAGQIDLTSLSTALQSTGAFLAALRELVKDSVLIDTIGDLLRHSENFLATLIEVATSADFLKGFVPKLLDDPSFDAALTARVLSALTAGGSLPDGTIALVIPDFSIALPPSCLIGLVPNSALASYGELTFARTGLTAGAALSGELSSVPVATVHQVAAPGAFSQDFRSRRGVDFKTGAFIVNPNGFWYEVTNFGSGTDWWPVEGEQTIFDLPVSANDFYPGSQFLLACPYQLALLGAYEGRILLALETGVDTIEATTQLASVAWTALQTTVLNLNAARAFRKISYRATRAANGTTFAAFINNAAVEAATTAPASANFRLRLRTTKLDLANPATGVIPTGSFVITAANIRAAFTPL